MARVHPAELDTGTERPTNRSEDSGGSGGRPARTSTLSKQRARLGYTLIGITMLVLLVILVVPLVYNVYISLHSYRLGGGDPEFIGFENYVEAMTNPRWLASLGRTFLFVVLTVGLQVVLGTLIALGLRKYGGPLRVIAIILLIPMMVSEVVAALAFRLLLSTNVSLVNWLIGLVGIEPQQWFGPDWAFTTIVVVDVWQHTPFVILIIYAAAQSLPQEVLDAAEVDGASGFKRFRYILLPLLQPAIVVVLMFRTIFAIRVFTQVWVLTGGGPADRTAVLGIDIYKVAFSTYDIGLASALSILLAIISFAIGYFYIRSLSRESLY